MEQKKCITWREVKEIVNQVPDELLDKGAYLIGEEQSVPIQGSEIVGPKNEYVKTDEWIVPAEDVKDFETFHEDEENDWEAVPYGTPLLFTDLYEWDEEEEKQDSQFNNREN